MRSRPGLRILMLPLLAVLSSALAEAQEGAAPAGALQDAPVSAQTMESARTPEAETPEALLRRAAELAAKGQSGAAAAAYREWLKGNTGADGYGLVLAAAVDTTAEVADALRLLAEHAQKIRDPAARDAFREREAALLRLAGRPEEALAVQLSLPETPQRLVERGALYLELGRREQAEQALRRAREDAGVGSAARYLLGVLWLSAGRGEEGEKELRGLLESQPAALEAPAALLALGEALRARGDRAAADEALRELQARFPSSPEAALASGERGVRPAAVPLRLLPVDPPAAGTGRAPGGEPDEPTAASSPESAADGALRALVQAGSFRDPANALDLVKDLTARGFPARVVESAEAGFHRVVVGQEQGLEQAQAMLLRLKDAGYEGVLLLQ